MTTSISSTGSSAPSAPIFIGIDVSLEKLDLARSDSHELQVLGNDADGIRQLVALLAPLKPALIVVEATGGLERALVDALLDAGLPAALVNPGHVRHFAKGLGILAKTDRIDARVLVEFGRCVGPRVTQKRSANQAELDALVTCRRQLTHVRVEQTNRRARTTSKPALRAIDAVLKILKKQIDDLDRQIRRLIESDDDFNSIDKLLRSTPGVGAVLSATMLAELSELGSTDRRQISALVGVAPFNDDSGPRKGKRAVRGGRTAVRSVLYMATLAAIRCNPVIRNFAQRLQKSGKRAKPVIVACMRKLITLLNAMIRDHLAWHELSVVKSLDL